MRPAVAVNTDKRAASGTGRRWSYRVATRAGGRAVNRGAVDAGSAAAILYLAHIRLTRTSSRQQHDGEDDGAYGEPERDDRAAD
jgi:hypothetical protein